MDIEKIYYFATTTHASSSDVTEAVYTIPSVLLRFIYSLLVLALVVLCIFYFIKEKNAA